MKKLVLFITAFMVLFGFICLANAQTQQSSVKYTVKKGDTFYSLSKRFETTVESITALNKGLKPEKLAIGTKLNIQPSDNLFIYTVVKNDTLYKISQKYKVSINIISKKNSIQNVNLIYVGDILAIPKTIETNLYFIESLPTKFKLTAEKRKVSTLGDIYENTMKELIKGSVNKNLTLPIPVKTLVLSVKINTGIAYVDFDSQILKCNMGSSTEALTLAAIANTLTEYPEIKGVLLYSNGKKIETLGGHILIKEPIKRNEFNISY